MLKIDLHLHTIVSGDASGTIFEFVQMAKQRGVNVIGITEHGPAEKLSNCSERYLSVLRRVPKIVDGIRILKSVEANILENGIDISDQLVKNLDYVMAGFHYSDFDSSDIDKNTEILTGIIKSGKINILSHPYASYVEIDIAKISEVACENDVLLEVNLSYFLGHRVTDEMLNKIKLMIDVVKKNGKKVIVNSDSHNIWELGDDSILDTYKERIGLTNDLIINNYPDELQKILGVEF